MSVVTYGQTGYVGCSMSENARRAYEDGELPRSKWTKSVMLDVISSTLEDLISECDNMCDVNNAEIMARISRLTKAELFRYFFEWTSWHHTGKCANPTDFYGIDLDAVASICLDGGSRIMADVAKNREVEKVKRSMPEDVPLRGQRAIWYATYHKQAFLNPAVHYSLLFRYKCWLCDGKRN